MPILHGDEKTKLLGFSVPDSHAAYVESTFLDDAEVLGFLQTIRWRFFKFFKILHLYTWADHEHLWVCIYPEAYDYAETLTRLNMFLEFHSEKDGLLYDVGMRKVLYCVYGKQLITGSRDMSDQMLSAVHRVLRLAKLNGRSIIVGDAIGVDLATVRYCEKNALGVEVYGVQEKPRFPVDGTYMQVKGNYNNRDRYMVRQCDLCYCIWNGKSKGAKATYDYAVDMNKRTKMLNFGNHAIDEKAQESSLP